MQDGWMTVSERDALNHAHVAFGHAWTLRLALIARRCATRGTWYATSEFTSFWTAEGSHGASVLQRV